MRIINNFRENCFMEFESRKSVVSEVWEALKDENVRTCSLCGMGGTGKTTLVKKLVQRAVEDHLFHDVAMATVSRSPDIRKIRGDIITSLGYKFESTDLDTSSRLISCIQNCDKDVLVILDDVWWNLDFYEIGLGGDGLKILLTSRNIEVCRSMGSQSHVVIDILSSEEAWGMFKEITTMEYIEKLKLHDIARKIADECGGLPIVIVNLARALKYEAKTTWEDSLLKLQKKPENHGLSEFVSGVYSCFQLSYDLLNDLEAQTCFRLCCVFPEDSHVLVDHLVFYGMAIKLFENVESIQQARDRVESTISKLKKSFWLLDDSEHDGFVRVHDVIYDFANDWLRGPKLEILRIVSPHSYTPLPPGYLEGMKDIQVLDVEVPSYKDLMVTALEKLRTLHVRETEHNEESLSKTGDDLLGPGDRKDLEFLEFSTSRQFDDFPEEIGLLCNLRCLYLGRMRFECIPPGILSKLVKLEELEMPPEFKIWDLRILNEIISLPLTTLRISVRERSVSLEKLVKKLTRLNIGIGDEYNFDNKSNTALRVRDNDISFWTSLLRKCDSFKLRSISHMENLIWLQSAEDNKYRPWKDIDISNSSLEYLVDTPAERIPSSFFSRMKTLKLDRVHDLKELCPGSKIRAPCFTNLSEIYIASCRELKRLFPLSFASDLRHLRNISISYCENLEEVFYGDLADDDRNQVVSSVQLITPIVETSKKTSCIPCLPGRQKKIMEENIEKVEDKDAITDTIIVFPKLKSVELRILNKLKRFYNGHQEIEFASLNYLGIRNCDSMEGLSYGSFNAPCLDEIYINRHEHPASSVYDMWNREKQDTGNDIQ